MTRAMSPTDTAVVAVVPVYDAAEVVWDHPVVPVISAPLLAIAILTPYLCVSIRQREAGDRHRLARGQHRVVEREITAAARRRHRPLQMRGRRRGPCAACPAHRLRCPARCR